MRRHVVTLVVTVLLIGGTFLATLMSSNRPLLGLDLQGGISVVLFPVKGSDTSTLDTAIDIIRNRVDALGIVEPEVTRQGDTIVIDLPGAKDRDQALNVIGQTAQLTFRPVLNILPREGAAGDLVDQPTTTTAADGATTSTTAGGATTTTAAAATTTSGDAAGRVIDARPIAAVRPLQETPASTAPADATPGTTATPGDTSATTAPAAPLQACTDDMLTPREDITPDAQIIVPGRDGNYCYVLAPAAMTGEGVSGAEAQFTQLKGWVVVLDFNGEGSKQFDELAAANVNKQVAIELDGVVQSAPTIQTTDFGGHAEISGDFGEGEARDLALVLRYGSLPVQFDEDEQTVQSVSPTLGDDQLQAGIIAGLVGLGLVALYMILYYRLLGLVVWIGLALTGMIFFTLVSWLSATQGLTLTLAGVTGLIVSVGVTVDSYVVYFERLKDEVRAGKTVRSSVESGFRRAFRTIIAADLVSLMGAVVLYLLATGSVRGFAFFLGLSTVIDLLLSYFFMYPLVVLMAQRPSLVRMRGLGLASGLDVVGAQA